MAERKRHTKYIEEEDGTWTVHVTHKGGHEATSRGHETKQEAKEAGQSVDFEPHEVDEND